MYLHPIVETSGNIVTFLPSEAVVSLDDMDYIFIYEKEKKEDGKLFAENRMVEVTKGGADGDYTEIIVHEGFNIK